MDWRNDCDKVRRSWLERCRVALQQQVRQAEPTGRLAAHLQRQRMAAQLRKARERAGMTIAELARATGVGPGTLAALEAGDQTPLRKTIEALLAVPALHLRSDWACSTDVAPRADPALLAFSSLNELQNAYLATCLQHAGGSPTDAARLAGVSRRTIHNWLQRTPAPQRAEGEEDVNPQADEERRDKGRP